MKIDVAITKIRNAPLPFEINEKDQKRFDQIRGYYRASKIFSAGEKSISEDEFLLMLGFADLNHFTAWYNGLSKDAINAYTKDWCPGSCCQSILNQLLRLGRKGKQAKHAHHKWQDAGVWDSDRNGGTIGICEICGKEHMFPADEWEKLTAEVKQAVVQ